MQKCAIIVCDVLPLDWSASVLKFSNPFALPILNKAWFDYWIDFCFLYHISELRLVTNSDIMVADDALLKMKYDSISVSHEVCENLHDRESILNRNSAFHEGKDLIYVDGFVFLHYDKNTETHALPEFHEMTTLASCRDHGVYGVPDACKKAFGLGENGTDSKFFKISPIDTLEDYYELSMQLMKNESERYLLSEFPADNHIYLGANIELPLYSHVSPHVIIGHNVRLSGYTWVGENTVIGNECCIDEHTDISESIVLEGTYIGPWLELRRKIILRDSIIDPDTGISITFSDGAFSSSVKTFKFVESWEVFVRRVCAIFLLCFYFIPFVTYRILSLFTFLKRIKRWVYRRFSLRFYSRYVRVLKDRTFKMVGAPDDLDLPDLPRGAFSYSEALLHHDDPLFAELDERYYKHHHSYRMAFKVCLRILMRNFVCPEERAE